MPEISILYKLKKTPTTLNIFLSFLNLINYVYVILIYHCKSQDSNHLFTYFTEQLLHVSAFHDHK